MSFFKSGNFFRVFKTNFLLYRVLRTPSEEIWPGVTQLTDYKTSFPNWKSKSLAEQVEGLDSVGLDLLDKMLIYDPAERITAKGIMQHEYFALHKVGREFEETTD